MGGELDTLASSAATTLVALMATDAWSQVKPVFRNLWVRLRPDGADRVSADLDDAETAVAAARSRRDVDAEAAVRTEWQGRLRGLLSTDPSAPADVERVLRELAPHLTSAAPQVTMRANARGHARIYQSTGDMEIHG
jgi:hypothetical protein